MQFIESYRAAFLEHLSVFLTKREPENLYIPIKYILELGGKRLRPVLTLLVTDLFGEDYTKALNAAASIEVFHNFTLVHDDIMDQAPLRRGQSTVHEKWDLNAAILSGDAMMIQAYQFLETYSDSIFKKLSVLFNKTALQVCEGQQYDMDFEDRDDVSLDEYLHMITYKTAVLVATSMKMGAIIANASDKEADAIYNFGLHLGIAFQIQDDYLDAFGDPEKFGKQVGGDIIENKKTILYLLAKENTNTETTKELEHLFSITPTDPYHKVEMVKSIYNSSGASDLTREKISQYTEKAYGFLDDIHSMEQEKKEILIKLGNYLLNREL